MKRVLFFILLIGIFLRTVFHFVEPAFNIDEISLGNNIKDLNFKELLYPLKNYQSAPPLYLWLQKSILLISPFKFWVNIKILSFLASLISVSLFYKLLIRSYKVDVISVLIFSIFVFNPFIIYNSLTLKQYGIDLVGVLFLLIYYNHPSFKRYNWLFFMIWCLISNIGLFGCTGYLLFVFFKQYQGFKLAYISAFFKKHYKLILAPLPYVFYFFWYLQQEGALELKRFMLVYWQDSFIPIDLSIFKYSLYLFHQFWIYFYNAYEVVGLFFMLLAFIPIYHFIKKRDIIYKNEIMLLLCVFLIHIILNLIHFYPLSDRLLLYISPLFILLVGASLRGLSMYKKAKKLVTPIVLVLTIVNIGLYITYMPFKNNNVVSLFDRINELNGNNQIYLSPRSKSYIYSFNNFTDNSFTCKSSFIDIDLELKKAKYLVSKVHKKIKPDKTSSEEIIIQDLIDKNKIKRIEQVEGYNLFEIIIE